MLYISKDYTLCTKHLNDIYMFLVKKIQGADFSLPAHFSPIYFPMGNAATGFFVMFALIAGVAGAASVISGVSHLQSWNTTSLPAAVSAATIAWSLTLLAMGYRRLNNTFALIFNHFISSNS